MKEYSEDANLYIITNSPIDTKALPGIDDAKKEYRLISSQFGEENINIRKIDSNCIENEYKEAVIIFESYIVTIYRILSGKGYITDKEWTLMIDKMSDSRYIFQDTVLKLGTTKPWILKGAKEEFVNGLLKRNGFYNIRIVPSDESNSLYDKPLQFMNQLGEELHICKKTFDNIEKSLNGSGYIGTRKRLNYLTIYDFLKYHLGINNKPNQAELIQILESCPDKNTVNIKSAIQNIKAIKNDFWFEYERYRSFKMISSLIYWFSASPVRYLTADMYEYFSNNIDGSVLKHVLMSLKIHTATLDTRKIKVTQKGTTIVFSNFSIENSTGNIYATIETGGYADSFRSASKKVHLTSVSEASFSNLEYNCTYYISLWEVFGDKDAVRLGNLKSVTPGIEWPQYDYVMDSGNKNSDFSKYVDDGRLEVSLSVMGDSPDYEYLICCEEGNSIVVSPEKGISTVFSKKKENDVTKLTAIFPELQYDTEYVMAVFVILAKNRKIFSKLVEVHHKHKKAHTIPLIKRSVTGYEITLDFPSNDWLEELSRSDVLSFACRSDRYAVTPDDGVAGLNIKSLTYDGYRQGQFKLICSEKSLPPVIYICGWLVLQERKYKMIIRGCISEISYDIKNNTLIFDKRLNPGLSVDSIPKIDFYAFDKNDQLVFSQKQLKIDSVSCQYSFQPSKKVRYVTVQASDMTERQMYTFKHSKTGATGKAKIGRF